jgi:2,4-dienoyl-CoA reductase-like NADH-dependent reductase (Old Yellow Enzyme family)
MNIEKIARPLRLRGVEVRNRLWMSPMAQYSASDDGRLSEWHSMHYGTRAVGGVGMVMVESTAIGPEDRCTLFDPGIWTGAQIDSHRELTDVIRRAGAVPGVQLQSAGRKSSHRVPWERSGQNSPVSVEEGGWIPAAPSAIPFGRLTVPRALHHAEIARVVDRFAQAAVNAHGAGYDVVEVHAAHGYLLHQFLSPIANQRTDEYGGPLENRLRLPLAAAKAVRGAFPADKPVFFRINTNDWADGGIDLEEAVEFAKRLHELDIDLLDITSGGLLVDAPPPPQPAVNVEVAERIREDVGISVAPVGQIGDPSVLTGVFERAGVDAVFLGRPLLRDPYFALRFLGSDTREVWPLQYHRAL